MAEASALAKRAERIRATDRARAVLKVGDRIAFTSCPGTGRTATFAGWDGNWVCCASRNDISPRSIFKLNGKPVSFGDPLWEFYDPNTGRAFGDHGTATQALMWAVQTYTDDCDAMDFLRAWSEGGAWDEWPEFYEWLMPYPGDRARRPEGILAAEDYDEAPF